ncbi:alpha/beta fold hydrolase [Rhodococcus sp. Z13]|uniref:Alpha/beta fold hydrolase n=1 Tax=Rhodococcus sacchari TaxID=2962047 RepID=A0ACD4DFT9_9NOCA|nr:alpha/beta hydrolase [Rhodococcus sp. Z13]UYP18932.1 alpha/beta fold hydrolase [Rhodococcus sp. Z13]
MGLLFHDHLHDEFGTWPLAYIPYGGADFGEIAAVARRVGDGDDGDFHTAWIEAGDRLVTEAESCAAAGHDNSARELFLRASAYYATAYHPLYGSPVDPRLLTAFGKQRAAFDAGLAIGDTPVTPSRIPFEDTTLPAYLIPAPGHENSVRPLIVFTNGYDATITDMYFASAVAALRRGYHCLLFDGPGQGEMLYEQNVPLRPDWEVVVRAVIDHAVASPIIDPERIVLSGWSLGGHLAPRAASGEHRLAAVVADPGQWSVAAGARALGAAFGLPPEVLDDPLSMSAQDAEAIMSAVQADPALRWKLVSRGFWVHGVSDIRELFAALDEYTLDGIGERISCPVVVTAAENDPLARGAGVFGDRLGDKVTLLRFTDAEGAGEHCEMTNRTLLNRRVLDRLDEILAPGSHT